MLDIPFPLHTVPVANAEAALQEMISEGQGVTPVYLGDRDVFSTEWAEFVDVFEDPAAIVAEARALDTERWFSNRTISRPTRAVEVGAPGAISRLARLPADVLVFPVRLASKLGQGRPRPADAAAADSDLVRMLRDQLGELERSGEGTPDELAEMRDVIDAIAADGAEGLFPDPVDYVTPRHGDNLAAGLVDADEPWETAAWLQHGAYAVCAPKAVVVAHCRWLWTTHGARLITASTDHLGFQMERPIASPIEAVEVMRRFELLGATEINGDRIGTEGKSLLRAPRLWVWWD